MSELPSLVDLRRELHAHPELSMVEHRTAERVEQRLHELGLRTRRIAGTGVVADVTGAADGGTILLRADMDALPITEATGLPYASETQGVMHACGHDCHMASLLGVAADLVGERPTRGSVRLLFQPGEEGARGMGHCIDAGVLESPTVGAAAGVHVWQWERVGRIALVSGPAMASVDWFEIRIVGRGGHAADPASCVDPVLVGAHLVTALQSIVARNVDPRTAAVVTVASLTAGTARNVIPDEAVLRGTVRAFDEDVRRTVQERIEALVPQLCAAFGATGSVDYEVFVPAVVNDPDMVDLAWGVAEEVVGAENVVRAEPTMVSEDVGLALALVPGVFAFVGADGGTERTSYPHHHPRFDVDEDCLEISRAFLAGVARAWLAR